MQGPWLQTGHGDDMPSSLSLGLVMPSEVEHIRESGIFDLPALLTAVRERGESQVARDGVRTGDSQVRERYEFQATAGKVPGPKQTLCWRLREI